MIYIFSHLLYSEMIVMFSKYFLHSAKIIVFLNMVYIVEWLFCFSEYLMYS